jgi:hypothetical protein
VANPSKRSVSDDHRRFYRTAANLRAFVRRQSWAGYTINMFEFEFPTGTRDHVARERDGRTQIGGPSVMLKPDLAQAIGVTLHELATNAAKYGALSVAEGQGRVESSRAEDRQPPLDRSGRSTSQTPDPQGLWHEHDAEHHERREGPGAARLVC